MRERNKSQNITNKRQHILQLEPDYYTAINGILCRNQQPVRTGKKKDTYLFNQKWMIMSCGRYLANIQRYCISGMTLCN